MNRTTAMILFQDVHEQQLLRAKSNLERGIPYWRIALKERMSPFPTDCTSAIDEIVLVVTLKLDRHGRMGVADEASQKAIDDWEQRYADASPCEFTIPMFWEAKA